MCAVLAGGPAHCGKATEPGAVSGVPGVWGVRCVSLVCEV